MSTAATAGSTPANQVQVQARSGAVTLTTAQPTKVVPFTTPMIDLNYTVLIEPPSVPQPVTIGVKTNSGFTITCHANVVLRWVALHAI